jgi:hypothetical protein
MCIYYSVHNTNSIFLRYDDTVVSMRGSVGQPAGRDPLPSSTPSHIPCPSLPSEHSTILYLTSSRSYPFPNHPLTSRPHPATSSPISHGYKSRRVRGTFNPIPSHHNGAVAPNYQSHIQQTDRQVGHHSFLGPLVSDPHVSA